jgi:flagellar protein FlbD
MIVLTRLNGPPFALNPDLIERADANPDTVITLVGGTKYVVAENLSELVERILEFRGRVIANAHAVECAPAQERNLRVVTALDEDDDAVHTTSQLRKAAELRNTQGF